MSVHVSHYTEYPGSSLDLRRGAVQSGGLRGMRPGHVLPRPRGGRDCYSRCPYYKLLRISYATVEYP